VKEQTPSASALTENAAGEDRLAELELRIARRADQLAHAHRVGREKDIERWRQAEHEIWSVYRSD